MAVQKLEAPTCDDRLMWDIESSRFYSPAVTVADEIGLFPLLEKSPATAQEVASRLSIGARGADALLAVLTALGLLVQHQGKFSNTETTRNYLLPNSPYYWGEFIQGVRRRPPLHEDVLAAVQRDEVRGNAKEWLAGGLDPEAAKAFTGMMHAKGLPTAFGVARRGDFSGVTHLLDVAGGSGCFCIAMAMRYPEMRFTVLELPSVCDLVKEYVNDYGLSDQIDTRPADMFNDPWPTGYDAVFFSDIFHDWNWDRCVQLGKRSYEALPSGGRIYLHEKVMADTQDGPLAIAAASMRMLLATQGKQYTAGELDAILRECGFEDVSVTLTSAYYSLVSARKP